MSWGVWSLPEYRSDALASSGHLTTPTALRAASLLLEHVGLSHPSWVMCLQMVGNKNGHHG